MKRLYWLLGLFLILSSCSEYQKAIKSTSHEVKYDMAEKLYQEGKYGKLIPLLEDIVYLYKGTEKGETLMFQLANSYYKTGDYIIAGYYFRKFVSNYSSSTKAEEAQYLSAYCYYLDAPRPTLDQSPTQKAIREFQIFLRKYPQSKKVPDCNKYVDELYSKLQDKSFIDAKLFYNMERYKSADIALENSLEEYPASPHREEIMYLLLKSNYLLAKNSITNKQQERLKETVKKYKHYMDDFPTGKYVNQSKKILKDTEKRMESGK